MKPDPMSVHNLAKKYAAYYSGKGVEFEDLLSAAMVGVLEACKRYDETKGAFTTLSVFWMRSELNRTVYKRNTLKSGENIRKQRFIESATDTETLDLMALTTISPENIYSKSEFSLEVKKASNRLTSRYKLAFEDFYYRDNYDKYMATYNSTKKQAIKTASNARLTLIQMLRKSLDKEAFV